MTVKLTPEEIDKLRQENERLQTELTQLRQKCDRSLQFMLL
jgi:hypothetical protein